MQEISLKKGKEAAIRRGHPWVFSGALANIPPSVEEGDWVVLKSGEKPLAWGHYAKGSIAIRILSDTKPEKTAIFYQKRIEAAAAYRQSLNLYEAGKTDCFRLVFAEGDQLSGLIVDYYAGVAVVQCHTLGMYKDRNFIFDALKNLSWPVVDGIYLKSSDSLHQSENNDGWIFGKRERVEALEYGKTFLIDLEEGQKTGFFIDQRENRRIVEQISHEKKVLNAFCYTGGFSLYALAGGAREVHSVDISARAMQITDKNVERNAVQVDKHQSFTADVFAYLKEMDTDYDLVILDPPAFAKSRKVSHNAVMGYKRINQMAMERMKKGSLLFTFSCSQNISPELFMDTIRAAAYACGRKIRLVRQVSQPEDHAALLAHPEGLYLKGLLVEIVDF